MKEDILEARKLLEKSKHKDCFELIDSFFLDNNREDIETSFNELNNHYRIIKTRYFRLIKEKSEGIISFENYDLVFNQISSALYSFFDSIIKELENHNLQNISQKVNCIFNLSLEFDKFSEKEAIELSEKIRKILNLSTEEFKYSHIERGSVKLFVQIKRSYELLLKIKSLYPLKLINNLDSIIVDDVILNRMSRDLVQIHCDLSNTNLSFQNLSGLNISNIDFSNSKMTKTKFVGTSIKGVNFSDADLSMTDFFGSKIEYSKFIKTNLNKSQLVAADIIGCDLIETRIKDSNFIGSNIHQTNFLNSNLDKSDFTRTNLIKVNFDFSTLEYSSFVKAKMEEVQLTKSKMHKTKFHSNQTIEVFKMGIDVNKCVFEGDNMGRTFEKELI